MTTTTDTSAGIPAAIPDRQGEDRVEAASRHLYDCECALHAAHQTRHEEWIAAANARLHEAVMEHLAALAAARGDQGVGK